MKFSVVTISFNQAEFLERTILSVISQKGVDYEYIIVDPGSTDGSRDIIELYRDHFAHVIFEKDQGPADGLNRGFSLATGDIYCYLNSDDMFEPDAFARASRFLDSHPKFDVMCGHAYATDLQDKRLRRIWSEPYSRFAVAYGAAIQIQPSTFIRREAFLESPGFNITNFSNWDGELLSELFLSGAKIGICDEFLSCYRLHAFSITNTGRLDGLTREYRGRLFEKIMGRSRKSYDRIADIGFRLLKHLLRPTALVERILHGRIYRRGL